MMYFDVGDIRYHLRHDYADDSRTVVACDDPDFKVLLTFNSSLHILRDGKDVGYLTTRENPLHNGQHHHLVLTNGAEIDLEIPCLDWHWEYILKAEVKAAKFFLNDVMNSGVNMSEYFFEEDDDGVSFTIRYKYSKEEKNRLDPMTGLEHPDVEVCLTLTEVKFSGGDWEPITRFPQFNTDWIFDKIMQRIDEEEAGTIRD